MQPQTQYQKSQHILKGLTWNEKNYKTYVNHASTRPSFHYTKYDI